MTDSPMERNFTREIGRAEQLAAMTRARRRQPMHGMTASAKRIEPDAPNRQQQRTTVAEPWQELAWSYYDTIGEIRYGGRYFGNALSKLRLFVGVITDPDRPPVPVDSTDEAGEPIVAPATALAAQAALARLRSPEGGLPEIQRDFGTNHFITGEAFLIGRPGTDDEPERWDLFSIDELVRDPQNPDRLGIRTSPASLGGPTAIEPLGEDAFILRIWQRHPRFSDLADSSMRAVLDLCDELQILTRVIRATALSRLPAGILKVPSDASDGPLDYTDGEGQGEGRRDQLTDDLLAHLSAPIKDEGSASGVVPFILRGERDDLAAVDLLTFDRPFDATAADQRVELIRRIANGVDLPPEVLLGMADANHWTAWQIDETTFSAHIEPVANLFVGALTVGYLQPALEAMGITDERIVVWYDATSLVAHPNMAQNVKDAHDRLAASDEALRKALGLAEEDAPDDAELARRVAAKQPASPQLAQPAPASPETVQPSTPEPAPEIVDIVASALVAAAPPLADLGRQLVDADRALRDRILVAADASLRRVLERAGARLRSRAGSDTLAADAISGVPNHLVAATLGPTLTHRLQSDLEELLAGAFDDLGERFDTWVARSQEAAIDRARRFGELDPGVVETIRAKQESDRSEAWALLLARLTAVVNRRLFDPRPEADIDPARPGEFDAGVLVPAGDVRSAVSRAGGGTGAPSSGGALIDATTEAVDGGIATGRTALDLLRESAGIRRTGFVWLYGDPGSREINFDPHLDLDFVTFQTFQDPQLANPDPWPPTPFYFPGDHLYCQCDFEPVLDFASDDDTLAVAAAATVGRQHDHPER